MLGAGRRRLPPRGGGEPPFRVGDGGLPWPRWPRGGSPGAPVPSRVCGFLTPCSVAQPASPVSADDLLLKVTPPRASRHLVPRARLSADADDLRDAPLLLVQAPAGFGKTSLLAQWRLEHLARGGVVAWLAAQPRDDPQRLVRSLALTVRIAGGRPTFGQPVLAAGGANGLEGITVWLAEVAQTALDLVLMVDEVDRLPDASRDALAYLARNAPPNLRIVLAARPEARLGLEDLLAYGHGATVGPESLRFRREETLELVRSRFGTRVDRDTAARLHDVTEGWPLGLQLALSLMASSSDPQAEVSAMAAHGGALHGQLLQRVLANLAAADVEFLIRVAVPDLLHPALAEAITGDAGATERLARLARDTPIVTAAEHGDWLHMHALAREELRRRFVLLPPLEQASLHARASRWLAEHGFVESAARHAYAAGERELAYELAERSLYESLMTQGRQDAVLEWLDRLPSEEIDRRPRLLLAAAWTLALSDRHEEASRLVERILAPAAASPALRCECALILSGAAVFADDPDRFAALHDPWAKDPPLTDPLLLQVHANRAAFRTLLDGEPALARLRQQHAPRSDALPALGYVARWGDFIHGLTYLWEGQVRLAEQLLKPALGRAEVDLGRRAPFTCMLAALLAAALWERDRPDDATAALANRLDVIEHSGLPEAVLVAFRTLARIGAAEGAEHRALELLGALDAVGTARGLPRLRIAAMADQVRLHARRFRPETCRELVARIEALLADPSLPAGPLWRRQAELLRDVAQGHAAIAAQDWRRALEPLARAAGQARALKQGRLQIEMLGLRAFVMDRCGEKSRGLLREAIDLAQTYGLLRVFGDAHPALGDWVRQVTQEESGAAAGGPGPLAAPIRTAVTPPREAAPARVAPSMALTPKEREVLELLARNLSNKEIALALQVGEETIKWHMKNLFAKLDAGTRKQVVSRSRILGLLPDA